MSAKAEAEGLKYGFAENANAAETLEISPSGLGQRNPQHCPHPREANATPGSASTSSSLGTPMNISEVAALLGCSPWTVRQRYMRQGLPCLRASATGKLVFYEKQVIDWILKRQQLKKGGNLK
jgi:hypothetical protein